MVIVVSHFVFLTCAHYMQPLLVQLGGTARLVRRGEKKRHSRADAEWFSRVEMQSCLSQQCKYLTDSYNSSLASAVHLNQFKSWLCQTDNLKLQQKLLPGAFDLQSLPSDILTLLIYCLWSNYLLVWNMNISILIPCTQQGIRKKQSGGLLIWLWRRLLI